MNKTYRAIQFLCLYAGVLHHFKLTKKTTTKQKKANVHSYAKVLNIFDLFFIWGLSQGLSLPFLKNIPKLL